MSKVEHAFLVIQDGFSKLMIDDGIRVAGINTSQEA